ncbi:hypothetical protein TKWG_13220 [Advenella kashmirensis WT001]|uniref:TetR family transcriptional regulator n=1 Tax=Advenella kashmirensis (strain DSM 17095 / LMG 22695 / WT001) TaxID=1036672 RepID=I3UCN0_ADVKW|nr:hypothetical protein TKWG_13220 [Advenella kashmirensis WT001]
MRDETFAYRDPSKALLKAIANGQKCGKLRSDIPAINLLDAYTAMFNRTFLMWEYRQRQYTLTSQLDHVFTILWDGIKANK